LVQGSAVAGLGRRSDRALAPGGGRAGAVAALEAGFGPRVAGLVDAVTNPEGLPGTDRHQQYREHVAESLAASPWARVIKASDFTDCGSGQLWAVSRTRLRRSGSPARPNIWRGPPR
jgi:hypothetical protein